MKLSSTSLHRKEGARSSVEMSGQRHLFPLRVSSVLPGGQGADLAFRAMVGPDIYYCKRDKEGRSICATEWFCSSLAEHVGVAVPDFAIVECPETGEPIWGSKDIWGVAGVFEVRDFLRTPPVDEIGKKHDWIGRYLSGLYALDLFLGNPDRQMSNFLLLPGSGYRRLIAMDFASARLGSLETQNFAIDSSQTLSVGRLLRACQGFFPDSALEMVDRIRGVPAAVIQSFMDGMPDGWLTSEQRRGICELWSNGTVGGRLEALRKGLRDESLL